MSLLKRLTALLMTASLLGLLTLALLVSVMRLAPPLTGESREAIAATLSGQLGYRVSIGVLRIGMAGWRPRLKLEHVALDHPDTGTRALALTAIELDLDLPASLLSRSVRMAGITLIGARLVLERGADGRLRVHGLDALASDDPRALEGFLKQGRLDLIESEILVVDPAHGGKQLRLVDTRLRLENAGERHWLDLSARPLPPDPLALATGTRAGDAAADAAAGGHTLQLAMRLNGPASAPRSWSGRGYLRLDAANLGLLLPTVGLAHGRLDTERARIEGWLTLESGRLAQALIRTDLHGLRLISNEPTTAVPARNDDARARPPAWHLSGSVRVRPLDGGWSARLAGLELGLDTAALAGLDLALRLNADGRLLELDGRLARLDLAELNTLLHASPWPLPAALRTLLERHPRGSAHDLAVAFAPALAETGTGAGAPRWQVSGRLSGLGLDQRDGLPGFAGLELRLAGDQDGGWVRLGSDGLDLDLKPLFDQPLRLDQFSGRLDWTRQPSGGWRIAARELALENADLRGQGRFALDLPGRDGRPFLDLRARFQEADAAQVRRYLPVGIMRPKLVDWLEAAIVSGRVTQGDALFRGALADHPFRQRQGRFELTLAFEDLRLDYQPGWPAIESAAGQLRFLDEGLAIRVERGRILDSDFSEGRVDLPDLARVERMRIHGEVQGPFEDGRRALAETPLAAKLGRFAEILQVSGRSRLVLDLDLPFAKQHALGVSGVLSWPGPAALGVRGTAIQLSGLGGAVRFDAHGIESSRVKARLAGRPLDLSLRTQDAGLHLTGQVDELDLSAWNDWAKATQLGQRAADTGGIALAGVELAVERLRLGERTLNAFRLRGTPGSSGWRVRIDSREVAGRIRPANQDAGTRLDLDLERLDLEPLLARPESEPTSAAGRRPSRSDPITALPSLDLHVERLDWGERQLGALDLSVHRDALGLRIPHLRLSRPGLLSVEGTGEWVQAPDGGSSRLDLKAETPDLRGVLRLLDEPAALDAKGARARIQLRWPGGPTRFAWAHAAGTLDIGVDPGRFLEAEPGVGRLLGFIDIGSIGRRLALDFSDLYGQGFAFERLTGRIAIGQGQARCENVLIQGPAGRVMVGGTADLIAQRFDQQVVVEPNLGTSVALASAVAGGPVVGAAVYLVDRATGNTLDQLGRYQYRVTGPWNEPDWTRLGWEPLRGFGESRDAAVHDTPASSPTNHFLDLP